MKRFLSYIALIALLFSITATTQITQECDATALKSILKKKLKPIYKYDSSKTTRFYYKTKTQLKEIEVPLYLGEKYRFLFNTDGVTRAMKVEIYNKPIGKKKRKLLYTLEQKEGQNIYTYEPEKSRKMYINYSIPKAEENSITKDCLVMVIGYKMKTLKDV